MRRGPDAVKRERTGAIAHGAAAGAERLSYAWVAFILLVILVAVNGMRDPELMSGAGLLSLCATAVPLVLLALAVTPSMLTGRGGIDLSLGPLAGFITVLIGSFMHAGIWGNPFVVVIACLTLGAATGAVNGGIITVFRVQPIVVTLGTYLVLSGLADNYSPSSGGVVPGWLLRWAGTVAGIPVAVILLVVVSVSWMFLRRTQYYIWLMGVGADDRVAYTSGRNVGLVRLVAYVLGGIIAGLAGLALTALINGGSSSVGPPYTLQSVAAVALGGTSLAGGRGGMFGSVVGAVDIFLIENLLTVLNVSVFGLDLAYGVILILAIVGNAWTSWMVGSRVRRRLVPGTPRALPEEKGLSVGGSKW